jgi:hypothetical protein
LCLGGVVLDNDPKLAGLSQAMRARPHEDAELTVLDTLDPVTYACLEGAAWELCLQEGYRRAYITTPLLQSVMLTLWQLHRNNGGAVEDPRPALERRP